VIDLLELVTAAEVYRGYLVGKINNINKVININQ